MSFFFFFFFYIHVEYCFVLFLILIHVHANDRNAQKESEKTGVQNGLGESTLTREMPGWGVCGTQKTVWAKY